MHLRTLLFSSILLMTVSPAVAETPSCENKGSNGMVTLLLCPAGLDHDAWRNAGIQACEGREPCGAWIWEDASLVPGEAPERHDLLTPEQVRAAKAVWINDNGHLMVLEKK